MENVSNDSVTGTTARLEEVAELAVGKCANVRQGERLLILTDSGGDPRLAEIFADTGRRRGAEVSLVTFEKVDSIDKIPEHVQQAMATCDVVIPLCKSRIRYSKALADVRQHGRVLYMADVPTELFLRPVVLETDYDELVRLGEAFRHILTGDHELRVTSKGGTDATMRVVADRNLSMCVCRVSDVGDDDHLPGGAWFACPIESSVNGVFVVDCSVEPGVTGGILNEPMALTYLAGRLVSVEGGAQAAEFQDWLESCDDEIWGFSHTGGGFNRWARRIGNLMEDERILGTFNVAGGSNRSWPGTNNSLYHFDAMILDATYSVDATAVCENGVFVHPLLQDVLRARTG